MPKESIKVPFEMIFIIKNNISNIGISINVDIERKELSNFLKSSRKYMKEKGNRIEKVFIRKV